MSSPTDSVEHDQIEGSAAAAARADAVDDLRDLEPGGRQVQPKQLADGRFVLDASTWRWRVGAA